MNRMLIGLVAIAMAVPALAAEDDPKGIDFFEKKIRPVLVANCYQCHSASSKELKGELRLDTREGIRKGGEQGKAVVPGKVAESLLITALKHEDGLEMPPKEKLSDAIVADFVKWVEMGAPDRASQTVRRSAARSTFSTLGSGGRSSRRSMCRPRP